MTQAETLEFMVNRIQEDTRLADKTPDKLPERLAEAYTNWVRGIASAITTASAGAGQQEQSEPGTGEVK